MNKTEKEQVVSWLKKNLEEAGVVVVTRQSGLNMQEVTGLRRQFLEAEAGYKVAKNTLSRLAVKGTPYENLLDFLEGPTALAFSKDPVAAAKIAVEFANENSKLEVVGGAMGEKVMSVDEVKALAKLPSLDELRGKLVGLLQAPAQKLASVTQAPASQLARVFSAYGASQ